MEVQMATVRCASNRGEHPIVSNLRQKSLAGLAAGLSLDFLAAMREEIAGQLRMLLQFHWRATLHDRYLERAWMLVGRQEIDLKSHPTYQRFLVASNWVKLLHQ
jgi:hypothetical protein